MDSKNKNLEYNSKKLFNFRFDIKQEGSKMSLLDKIQSYKNRTMLRYLTVGIRVLFKYLVTGVVVILIALFFYYNNFFYNFSAENERYILSALVQSEAAILAIVISASLIAMQLAASFYTPRVIEIFKSFKENPDLYALIFLYIITMGHTLLVLKSIDESGGELTEKLKISTIFSFSLGISCFSALIPYVTRLISLLKPSTIINVLSSRITEFKVVEGYKNVKEGDVISDDPFQPIVDIILGAMKKYDHETTKNGLKAIEN
ncbi:hypothetical protein DRP07_05100, partial [Archaeoglobales archaeon]